MNRIIYLSSVILFFLNFKIYSQENKSQINNLSHSISFGWSNPITLIRSITDPNQQEKIGILIDYQLYDIEGEFYRFHLKFSPFYSKPTFNFRNFLISVQKGKKKLQKENFNFGHGLGPYFRCNIFRGQQASGTQVFWSSDYYGLGMEYAMFFDYKIKENLYLNLILNLNIGIHQYYDASIVNSQEYWGLRIANQQLISIALKKQL